MTELSFIMVHLKPVLWDIIYLHYERDCLHVYDLNLQNLNYLFLYELYCLSSYISSFTGQGPIHHNLFSLM